MKRLAEHNRCCAVIVAAGSSSRMKSTDSKIWIPLSGTPAIAHTLLAFEKSGSVDDIVVVCRKQDKEKLERLQAEYSLQKLLCVVLGGGTRQQSVACGIAAAPPQTAYFAVHDGARPLVLPEQIDRAVSAAERYGAIALAVPARDTVKRADADGMVLETPPRDRLWYVQTPQVIRRELYEQAVNTVQGEYTDDCQLIEKAGGRVFLCEGSPENIKLTTPEDVLYAEAVLRKRRGGQRTMRIGHGYDVHRFAPDRPLILGGVLIPYEQGLLGHSDADVLSHAVADALLGAAALGDLGKWFPDSDPQWKDADSLRLLHRVCELVGEQGWQIQNIDATIVAQEPKMSPYIEQMRGQLAAACNLAPNVVSVKATTEEHLGFTGAKQGIAVHAVCLIG